MHIPAASSRGGSGSERLHDVGPDQGISHAIVAETAPMRCPARCWSAATRIPAAPGRFNCAARGIGAPDLIARADDGQDLVSGRRDDPLRFRRRSSRPGVSAKDLFLHIAGIYGHHTNQNVEFGGPGLASLSINARRTIAAMGAELSAEFATFECDDFLIEYVKARNPAPFKPHYPDPDAVLCGAAARSISPRCGRCVALPDAVIRNSVPVAEVARETIQQAFIGSCANGTLDDLAEAARVMRGPQVARGVRLIVTPGSQATYAPRRCRPAISQTCSRPAPS